MKKILILSISLLGIFFSSCVTMTTEKNRDLLIDEVTVNEQDFGGCERWYAVDSYEYDLSDTILFQVGYFNNPVMGFVLFGDGTTGTEAMFQRQGLDLRWDWGAYERDGVSKYAYCFVIEPDGTGLYYDFSTSSDGTAKPRGIYKTRKF